MRVERVDLTALGVVLPSDRVGMVFAQPFCCLTAVEPYRCTPETKDRQLSVLTDTLNVSRAAPHQVAKTHFTILPEYSIPGVEGIVLIQTGLAANEWPSGTVVIGGTDALSKSDFSTLADQPNTYLDKAGNNLTRVANNEWVNCNIIWVKAADGSLHRWLQPKLFPAWPEQNVKYEEMFQGASVFTFRGPLENGSQYRFTSLICFDWIATVSNQKAWRWSISDLNVQATEAAAEISLSWFFVIQHNSKPSHRTFMIEVPSFFDQSVLQRHMLRRDSGSVKAVS